MLRFNASIIPKYYLILIFNIFITNICFGQDFVISQNLKLPHNLSSSVSIFEDATTKLSLEEVKKQSFTKNKANRILLPFANQATWLKIDLKNNASSDSTFYLFIDNNLIRRTTFYTENQTDSLTFEPFRLREATKLKYPNFQIKLKQGEAQSFYFKLVSQRGIYFNLKLYDSISFEKFKDGNKTAFGFLGGLTLMVFFIVFAIGFLIIKDSKSRVYAIYTLFRAIGFWASFNVLGSVISANSMASEKIAFVFMSINPMLSAFLALYILPLNKLPKWVKKATDGFIIVNLLLLIYSLGAYGSLPLKFLVILTIISHLFFYSFYIYTLVKRTNEHPFYSIPLLLGNSANIVLNLRVSGIINFDYITELSGLMAIIEMAVYVFYLSQIFRASVKTQAEKLKNLGFEAEKATKLEELDKLKTRFFTNISHEFRTPLTLLVGPIDDLQKKYPQEGIIATMQRNLQRLQTLINQILDLSKLESGEMKANLQEVDLAKFLDQLFASFESLAQSKGILFNHSQSHLTQIGMVDIDKLEKIIVNLLSNAFKFTEKNGRISLRIEYLSNKLKLVIKDTGIGISEERLPKIFDRFYQVEEHKNYEGTGVGLALVHELVDLLKGNIEVISELGKGTTFTLTLPFEQIEKLSNPSFLLENKTNLVETFIEPKIISASKIDNDSQSIMLIVEDNPDLRNYIASIFENQYQLILAIDGEDGLSKATEFIPDVVISDLMMPKLDGLGFCEKLKTDERTNHIPVILLTAKASLADKLIGLEHGADDYLSKPFNKEELQIRVKNLVSQRQKLLEKFSNKAIIEKVDEIHEPTIDEIFINKCKSVIDKYLDKSEFDVEKFANEMNLSSVQLRRKLKAISDQTVTEFVRNYRLEIAANLLKKSDLNVSEIAYKVGFDSLPYFSKVFQEKYGKTASEWK